MKAMVPKALLLANHYSIVKKNRKPKLPVFHKEWGFINTFYQSLKLFYC